MQTIPSNAPKDLYDAFAYIGSVRQPTVDDFRLMVLLEAAGKNMYDDLAADCTDPEIGRLLLESGHDEFVHAERMAEVVSLLTGELCTVPHKQDNPYLVSWRKAELSPHLVDTLIKAEAGGEALYEGWAKLCSNPAAARLLRLNGREETAHAQRLHLVAQRMPK